ncbi:carbohydrate-binding family 9-like protein [Paenibacillus senegalensis]|uniref:carbohydrate-binding family 9-like protein n=1 Tax=Paenibacillus senegalensis TaxID=1465766 RepID=UPI000287D8BB|nr:carbohydrate-binding family 9-like protein [Paenibacillus senegalensis]
MTRQVPVYSCMQREVNDIRLQDLPAEIWEGLPEINLVETVSGSRPRQATKVRSFWSKQRPSLFFRFEGDDDHIVSTMTKHDDPIYSEDVVEVFLSETGSLQHYKEFELSPANVKFDAKIQNSLDGNIQIRTEWHAEDWVTVFNNERESQRFVCLWELPFHHFTGGLPAAGSEWLMNVYRIDRHPVHGDEYSAWSPTGEINFHLPHVFGRLAFKEMGSSL